MNLQLLRAVLREVIVTFGPALIAILNEVARQVESAQEPDWRTLIALGLAQVVTLIARFMVPPEPAA